MKKDKKNIRYGFVVAILFIILFVFYMMNSRFLPEKNRNRTVNDIKIEAEIPGDERSPIIRSYELQEYESFSQKKKEGIKEEIKGRVEGDIPCADISGDPRVGIMFYDGSEIVQPTGDVKIRMTIHPSTFYGKYEVENKVIDKILEKVDGTYSYPMEQFFKEEGEDFIEYSEIELLYEIKGIKYISLFGVNISDKTVNDTSVEE